MTPEERQLLTGLFDRTRQYASQPRDRDAEAMIADAVRTQPYAPYLLAQTVLVQEEAMKAAAARIEELEARNQELEAVSRQQPAGAGGFLGGLGKSIFGDSPRPGSVPRVPAGGLQGGAPQGGAWGGQPQPQQGGPWAGQPGWNPAQQQQPAAPGGGGFLKGALGAAAGIAGGVLLANSLSGLFSGQGNNPLGIGSGLDKAGADTGNSNADLSNALNDKAAFDPAPSPASWDQGERHASYDDSGWGGGDSSEA
jgi:hypothetical protein